MENENGEKIKKQIDLAKVFDKDYSKMKPLEVAKEVFGFNGFKENGQSEIIDLIIKEKKNVMGIMPTGGGKSACYQVPALIQENITVIVSPLIALMKDQVESLVKNGFPQAFYYNSTLSEDLKKEIISLVKEEKVKLFYIAPESLQSEDIQTILGESKIDLSVIPELIIIPQAFVTSSLVALLKSISNKYANLVKCPLMHLNLPSVT